MSQYASEESTSERLAPPARTNAGIARSAGRALRGYLARVLNLWARCYIGLIYRIKGPTPVSHNQFLFLAQAFQGVFRVRNGLSPKDECLTTGSRISTPEVRSVLANHNVGGWALDAWTLDTLWGQFSSSHPNTLLEFGSGISTIMLGEYCRLRGRESGGPIVISVEQNVQTIDKLRPELIAMGLEKYVIFICAPLTADHQYQIDFDQLQRSLNGRPIDVVVIDGPFGPPGCRKGVLELVRPFCRAGTVWYLDDAFRDGELEVLKVWAETPGISVFGIYPYGKGLASGTVEQQAPGFSSKPG